MNVPVVKPDIVVVELLPEYAPEFIVQVPAGNPESKTEPVETEHVGCVIVPTTGADGVAGCAFITTFDEPTEMQPVEFVTVKL